MFVIWEKIIGCLKYILLPRKPKNDMCVSESPALSLSHLRKELHFTRFTRYFHSCFGRNTCALHVLVIECFIFYFWLSVLNLDGYLIVGFNFMFLMLTLNEIARLLWKNIDAKDLD